MDIYENLNTCNVLYNRPSCLDKTYATKNITDNNRLLYKLKLLQLSPAFLRDGVYEYFKSAVESSIDGNVSELLCLSIALMGGAYKEQLNYLGLFPIKEVTGKSSVCRCYIQNINKRTFNIGTNIIDTIQTKDPNNKGNQIFYHLTDVAKELCAEKLSLLGEHPLKKNIQLKDIAFTHKQNLEHAAGVIDLYAYILGNPYYPAQFDFSYEHICNISDETYFVSDGLVTTMYKNETDSVFKATDYVEVDTGSQGSEIIKEKIVNYTNFFTNQKCVPALNNIIFINHPNGICSNLPGKKNTAVLKKPTFLESVASLYLGAVFNNASLTINELRAILIKPPADIAAELKDVTQADFRDMLIANKDKFISILDKVASLGYGNISLSNLPLDCIAGMNNNIVSDCNSNGDFNEETIPAENVYSTNNTCVTNFTDASSITTNTTNTKHTNSTEHTSITNAKTDTQDNYNVHSLSQKSSLTPYQEKYCEFHKKYIARKNLIFNKAINCLKNENLDIYEQFISLCKNGLSLSCVFGGDMYETFLSIHPNMSGMLQSVIHIINKFGFNGKYHNNDFTYLPAAILGSLNDTYVLKNILTSSDNSNATTTFAIEDISIDYGSRIRIKKALSETQFNQANIRLIIITDSYIDAYCFIADICNDKENLTVTENNIVTCNNSNVTESVAPIFIPREYVISEMIHNYSIKENGLDITKKYNGAISVLPAHNNNKHMKNSQISMERPFVFTGHTFLNECINEFHNGNQKDFFAFFRKKLQGKAAIRDIVYL